MTISTIPKEDTGSPNVRNFKPIPLLNVDYNFFTKIISERLKKILKCHVRKNQAGFLLGRYIKDNIRTVLNVIELIDKRIDKKIGLFFLDAKKAFDNIN